MIVQSVGCGNYYGLRIDYTNTGRFDGGLGLVRGYLTSIGAASGRKIVSTSCVSEIDSVLKNYLFRRLLSSGAPKKGSKICGAAFLVLFLMFCLLYDFVVQSMKIIIPNKRKKCRKETIKRRNIKVLL